MADGLMWNWQYTDWPNFEWTSSALRIAEARFLEQAGVVIGAARHLDGEGRQGLHVDILSLEAVDSSAIEGERLDRDSVQSSIMKQLGLSAPAHRAAAAEAGMAQLMVDLFRQADKRVTDADLKHWHRLIMNGRTDIAYPGDYRRDPAPMQIVSGAVYAPKVHFEAPPADRVGAEMARLCDWLNLTAPEGEAPLGAIARAGIAHLWFESIHPFEDGNGRVGRALVERVLSQALLNRTGREGGALLTGVASILLRHRKAYYAELERASRGLEIDGWLGWFAERVLEAQQRTLAQIDFIVAKSRFMDRHRSHLNARQERVLLRMLAEGPDGFRGGLSAANYISLTGASTATTTRDLSELVEAGALTRTGERKGTRYWLNLA